MVYGILDIESTGLEPFNDRVVAIGLKRSDGKEPIIKMDKDEKDMLEWFWNEASKLEFIVGWNIDRFDIWFIKIRSMKYNIKIKRMRTLDMMKVLFYEASQKWKSLDDVSEFLFNERKESTGQMVQEAFLNNDSEKISKYLKGDVELTEKLFKRLLECEMVIL